jgi:DNA-binding IclR family transcriptional regulator
MVRTYLKKHQEITRENVNLCTLDGIECVYIDHTKPRTHASIIHQAGGA